MAREPRKVVVRGELRDEPDIKLLAIAFLLYGEAVAAQKAAGMIPDPKAGEGDA
jgi:hypothetical protein